MVKKQRDARFVAGMARWILAFARQSRGNVAMMFGMALPLLLMVGLGSVDIHQASRVKANLQDALDAAALAAARSTYSDEAGIQKAGLDALKANMPDYFATGSGDTATFVLQDNVLIADAKVDVKVLVANIILPPYGKLLDDYLPVSGHSEVLRASRNVEVGLALDVTLSMQGTPLNDLRDAATDLVNLVVQDQQLPFYSKMAIVPYASGVNLGPSKAVAARGPVAQHKAIQSARLIETSYKTATSITKAAQAELSVSSHGFQDGTPVMVYNASSISSLNNRFFRVQRVDNNKIKLKTMDGRSFFSTSGLNGLSNLSIRLAKCVDDDCGLVVGASNHGFSAGDAVYFDELSGLTTPNKSGFLIAKVINSSTFTVPLDTGTSSAHTANTGKLWCAAEGCQYFYFRTAANSYRTNEISSCVTERTGAQAYRDSAPEVGLFGRNYPQGTAACPSSVVVPLTSSRPSLLKSIKDLKAEGTTGGQIGVAWGWNAISPQFASFWGGSSAPGVHDPDKTLKVMILMTDGEFNSPYCKGVLSSDAAVVSQISNSHLIANCPSPNGNPFAQAVRLCEAMKNDGVIVYTVGFNLNSQGNNTSAIDTAIEVMKACATTEQTHFHDTKTGADLRKAFRSIGNDISRLRLAR